MPKRKRGAKRFVGKQDADELLGTKIDIPDERSSSYYHDEIHEYNLERENKLLLQDEEEDNFVKHYNKEEVLALEESESEDEDYHFDPGDEDENKMDVNEEAVKDDSEEDEEENEKLRNMDSDIEDDDDDLPDARAWGKKKSVYYNTDYVDKGYRDYGESDAEAAEAEEREILALEKRLTEEMEEADFGFDFLQESKPEKHEAEEKIKVDLQSLSKQEKLEFLERDSPEFLDLRNEFVTKLTELQEKLQPLIDQIKEKKIPPGQWREYILTKYQLILQYCTNISFYFVLKAKGVQASDHPVMKRISSHKKLLQMLDSFKYQPSSIAKESEMKEIQNIQHKPLSVLEEKRTQDFNISDDEDEEEDATGVNESKRGITYEIAKNKGLTPYRKKELRNPRVKHRRKFERAKVRRKGQFREPVKEITKYGGEFSGIRTGVTKSTKLK